MSAPGGRSWRQFALATAWWAVFLTLAVCWALVFFGVVVR